MTARRLGSLRRRRYLRFETLEARRVMAYDAQMLADLATVDFPSSPTSFTATADGFTFRASAPESDLWRFQDTPNGLTLTPITGKCGTDVRNADSSIELWLTDRSPQGECFFDDFHNLSSFTRLDDRVYFTASSSSSGHELYSTDGTVAGTTVVRDVTGPTWFWPELMGTVAGKLLLSAQMVGQDGFNDVWISDGTAAGTQLLKDIPFDGSWLGSSASIGDRAIFSAQVSDNSDRTAPWVTDGTSEGTFALQEAFPGSAGVGAHGYQAFGNFIYFAAPGSSGIREVWRTDGTVAGTMALAPGLLPEGTFITGYNRHHYFSGAGDAVYFAADDGIHGVEPWRILPSGQVEMVADVVPGPASSHPSVTVAFAGGLQFTADGRLYRVDAEGEVIELGTVEADRSFQHGIVHDDVYYFAATDPQHGTELWRSDGTAAGTHLFRNLEERNDNSQVRFLQVGERVFAVQQTHDGSQWIRTLLQTDGTPGGTTVASFDYSAIFGQAAGASYFPELFTLGDYVYYNFRSASALGQTSEYLARWDGVAAQHERVLTITSHQDDSVDHLTQVGDQLFFFAGDRATGQSIYRTNGTPGDLHAWSTFPAYSNISDVKLAATGDKVFALIREETQQTLRAGSATGSAELVRTFADDHYIGWDLLAAGGLAYIKVNRAFPDGGTWRSDGTVAGTYQLSRSGWTEAFVQGDYFYSIFSGGSQSTVVTDLRRRGPGSDQEMEFFNVRGELVYPYFAPRTYPVADGFFFATQGKLYFSLDGAPLQLVTSTNFVSLGGIIDAGDRFFFSAATAEHGSELWTTDTTEAGTYLVTETWPGPQGRTSAQVYSQGIVYGVADDGWHGLEPFAFVDESFVGNVLAVEASKIMLTDNDVGATIAVRIQFDVEMHLENAPLLSFLSAGSTFALETGQWVTDREYVATFRITDANVSAAAVQVRIDNAINAATYTLDMVERSLPLRINTASAYNPSHHNIGQVHDVNFDTMVTPLDALLVIVELNARGPTQLPQVRGKDDPVQFLDVSGDGYLTPLDAVLVINALNAGGSTEMPRQPNSRAVAPAAPVPVLAEDRLAWLMWQESLQQVAEEEED